MKKRLLLLLLTCCLVVSGTALAVSAAADENTLGGVWSQDGSAYTVTGTAGGGIGTVSYSENPWTTVGEGETAVTTFQAVRIPVTDYVPGQTLFFSMKHKNAGAYMLLYFKYAAGTDEDLEPYPAAEKFVSVDGLTGNPAAWNTKLTDYGEYRVTTVDCTTYIPTQTVTEIVMYFEKSPEDSTRGTEVTETRSVEFMGMKFHTKDEKPFAPTEPTISAPAASSGITSNEITLQSDGSYRIGYTTGANYSRLLVNFANFTPADKCLTFEFTPYAGMKFGLYAGYVGGSEVMISAHKVYPVAEKQTIKFELDGETAIDHLKLYVDINLPIDDMVYFTLNSVTLEKHWPVLFSGLSVDAGSASAITQDGSTFKIAAHGAAYYQLSGTVNPAIWQKKPLMKHFALSFTPAQEMLVGVYGDSAALTGKNAAGETVSGHVSYPAGVKQTLTFDLSDEDFASGPETLKVYLDAGVAADAAKQIEIHEAELYPEPNVTDLTGDAIYYVKYDAATRETVVKFSDHGTWYKIASPISDYRDGYDVIAFRVKADRDMYLGLRLTNADSLDGTGNIDLRPHTLIEANKAYDLVYTGYTVNENTRLEIFCDAPGPNYQPVPDGETVLTIQSIDFLRSADLQLPALTVSEQAISQEYTGTNQAISPLVSCDKPVEYTYEYLDVNKPDAKWSATAPVNAGTYDVRVVTELTREYMTVTDSGHITLTVTQSSVKQDLPAGAVTVDYGKEIVLFGAAYEVNRADTFAPETALVSGGTVQPGETLYLRIKETPNVVAGNTVTSNLPARAASPAAYGIDFAAGTTASVVGADVEYSPDGVVWTAGTGDKLALQPGVTYYFRKKAGDGAFASQKVQLAAPARAAAPAVPELKESGTDFIELNAVFGAEYSLNGGAWQDSARFEGLTEGALYTVEIRIKATDSAFASQSVTGEYSAKAAEKIPPTAGGCGTITPATFGGIGGALVPVVILLTVLIIVRRKNLGGKTAKED